MLTVHRYHEISESTHLILNPLSLDKLTLLEQVCAPSPGADVLDLGSGRGEMLCRLAAGLGTRGVGVDIYPPWVDLARQRAAELSVTERVEFVVGDGADYDPGDRRFDVVAAIGTTWIGGGLVGTLELLRRAATPDAWYLLGELFWERPPTDAARREHDPSGQHDDLSATLERLEGAGFDLVEMVLASRDDWDRYSASQWLNVSRWLDANPDDPDAGAIRQRRDQSRRAYLADRDCLGWGVFVLRSLRAAS